ncbi:hypothetical protein O6H91_19G084800 [Diphasiastrum complanatum]|uniref:Uncharacterized protein n=1 Tax=Diphasiastrum complanatum TaxID=34168 RepID=A0ACC2AXD0_DIPCM|nr:hypothetical protein O6H91_19G084800 [Diphasiastrum complanatum]
MAREEVQVQARSTVVPSYPTPTFYHPLCDLVTATKDLYMHSIYYFSDNQSCSAEGKKIASLKISLSAVLSQYPVVSGRLRAQESGGLIIKCNDAGMRCLEASTKSSLREFLQAKEGILETELYPSEPKLMNHTLNSLAMIQITEFSCGGIAIGLSWSHAVADAFAMTLFMKAWGEVHRGQKIQIPPVIHSSLERQDQGDSRSLPRLVHDVFFPGKQASTGKEGRELRTVMLHFSAKAMQSFEREICNGSSEDGSSTNKSFVAITALLWRSISLARSQMTQPPSCIIFRENRKLQTPSLPDGYFGNALQIVTVSDHSMAGELSQTAKLLRERLDQVCGDHDEATRMAGDLQADALLCYWADLPFYEVELNFGKPIQVTCGVETPTRRESFFLQPASAAGDDPHSARSVDAVISLQPQHLQILLQDEFFLKFLKGRDNSRVVQD